MPAGRQPLRLCPALDLKTGAVRWVTRALGFDAWTLDPDTGAVQWITQAGPGGTAGGLQRGSAVDGQRVYTANANRGAHPSVKTEK